MLRAVVAAGVSVVAVSVQAAEPALIDAAKKEGEVIWYTTQIISPARASRERRLREEIRHQGALDARQLDRTFGQDHQREPGGQAAIRRVRRHLDGRAAQEGRLRAAMAAGSGQGLSGAVQGPGGLLGRQQPVLPDAGLQHRARSQRQRSRAATRRCSIRNGAARWPGARRPRARAARASSAPC